MEMVYFYIGLAIMVGGAVYVISHFQKGKIQRHDKEFVDWAERNNFRCAQLAPVGTIGKASRVVWGEVGGKRFFLFFQGPSGGGMSIQSSPACIFLNGEAYKYTPDRDKLLDLISGGGGVGKINESVSIYPTWDYSAHLAANAYLDGGVVPDFGLCKIVADIALDYQERQLSAGEMFSAEARSRIELMTGEVVSTIRDRSGGADEEKIRDVLKHCRKTFDNTH